jgi:Ca2+/Na+ antiporter
MRDLSLEEKDVSVVKRTLFFSFFSLFFFFFSFLPQHRQIIFLVQATSCLSCLVVVAEYLVNTKREKKMRGKQE